MDLNDAITVTKLDLPNGRCYLMIGWQTLSFEMYIYTKENLWKGRFSHNRLSGFSRNLHMTEEEYYKSVKHCLSQQRENYSYDLKSGFFYWKRILNDALIMEGFIPVDIVDTSVNARPDLLEVLLALNRHLRDKVNGLLYRFKAIKTEYYKCLKDTEEFINLKVEMEKTLCNKFLNLLSLKKAKFDNQVNAIDEEIEKKILQYSTEET